MSKIITTIDLSSDEREYLVSLIRTRTIQAQIVDRARMLLWKADGRTFSAIADALGVSIPTVRRCIDRFNTGGMNLALFDDERSGRPVEITDDAKAWIISVACQRPCCLGYTAELWTLAALHKYIQKHCVDAGYPRLKTVTKPWLQKYLKKMDMKPFKIKYYLERKDPDFENKTHDVLLVNKQVEMQFDENGNIIVPENRTVRRNDEYACLGTLSLDAGIDLLTGEAIPLVSESHKNSDFVAFLKILDEKYPEGDTIRLILDNHSIHKSQETKRYLATLPEDRFVFVYTPAHSSWLNLIENFFSKMTKQMLKGIQVNCKEELSERIYRYFDEINMEPIIYPRTDKMDDVDLGEAANSGL